MSFLIAQPEAVGTAAADLAGLGSTLDAARLAQYLSNICTIVLALVICYLARRPRTTGLESGLFVLTSKPS